MQLRRRFALSYVVWLAACTLVACSRGDGGDSSAGTAAGETPTRGGSIVRHLEHDCKTLNWVLYNTSYENVVLRCLYDYLLDYDENMNIVPVLAESYRVSDDGLKITVLLREGPRWHDGTPITADDVKFTLDKILDPEVPAVNKRGWFKKLEKADVVDDRTIVFVWSEPYAPSLHALAQLAPIPKHIYGQGNFLEHPANRAPVGSGPFVFDEWRTSQMISIVRNENYWGEKAFVDRIVFRVISEQAAAFNALRAGDLDEMRVRQIQWETQTNDADFQRRFDKKLFYVPQYNYLAWNCKSVWFKDRRVRKAMTMLFDRETINDKIFSGLAQVVTGPFYVGSWAYDKSIEPIPFDPSAAAALLAEAGWVDSNGDGVRDKDGVKFEFNFNVASGSQIAMDLVQVLQAECTKAGIVVNVAPLEGATYFERVFKGDYVAAALAWRLDYDPDIYDTFHSSQIPTTGLNHGFYKNARVDSLLELGRGEFDRERRAAIYHEVHRLIHDDQPYTFINSVPEKHPISKRIGNVVVSAAGLFDFYPGARYWFVRDGVVEAKKSTR